MTNGSGKGAFEPETIPLNGNIVYLKAECDFRNRTDLGYFYYSLNGKEWTPIGNTLKMEYTLPHFMGYRFGIFNYATQTSGGYVDIDYFRIEDKISK